MSRESKSGKKPEEEKLAGALSMIAELVLGDELESTRKSVIELQSTLTDQIDAVKEQLSATIDQVKEDLAAKEQTLENKLKEFSEVQATAQFELQQHADMTQRNAAVLEGLATVFSPAQVAAANVDAAKAEQNEPTADESVESTIDQIFDGDSGSDNPHFA